jgi:hypothetical protein
LLSASPPTVPAPHADVVANATHADVMPVPPATVADM